MGAGTSTKPLERAPAPGATRDNVSRYLTLRAAERPDRPALLLQRPVPEGGRWTFAELDALVNRTAAALQSAGIQQGQRVLVMVPPGVEFVTLTYGLWRLGAAPVLIDPGMGVWRLLECIRNVEPHALVGVAKAQVLRLVWPRPFRSVRTCVTVGRRLGWRGDTLDELLRAAAAAGDAFVPAETTAADTAAILFTSGSTGPAKGVVYEHGMFDAQVRWIQELYGIEAGEVDLSAFPLFSLFAPAMGMTSVVPDIDPTRPARVDPRTILAGIEQYGVTNTFGSPALWDRVSTYAVQYRITLPTVRRVLIAGAPVAPHIIENTQRVLASNGEVYTPYGATEALPVCSIGGAELQDGRIAAARGGAGTCVGRPAPQIDLEVVRMTDDAIPLWTDDLVVADRQVGEIVVAGEVVTKEYFGLPDATLMAKIADGDGVRHRMGDLGYRDEEGYIWFCGRKSHRVETARGTLYTDPCEAVFNTHPEVRRSALVGVVTERHALVPDTIPTRAAGFSPRDARAAGFTLRNTESVAGVGTNSPPPQGGGAGGGSPRPARRAARIAARRQSGAQTPVIVVELRSGRVPRGRRAEELRRELLALAAAHEMTRPIQHVLFHRSLPVDVRHNAKINREALAKWAGRRID